MLLEGWVGKGSYGGKSEEERSRGKAGTERGKRGVKRKER